MVNTLFVCQHYVSEKPRNSGFFAPLRRRAFRIEPDEPGSGSVEPSPEPHSRVVQPGHLRGPALAGHPELEGLPSAGSGIAMRLRRPVTHMQISCTSFVAVAKS